MLNEILVILRLKLKLGYYFEVFLMKRVLKFVLLCA